MLVAGALQAGFPTELWTVKRVRALVAREFGVEYTNSGGWELLRSLGFSPQKPEKRATQRDDRSSCSGSARLGRHSKKKARREQRTIVFIDESGLSEEVPRHSHLGAQGAHAHHSAKLHLEADVGGRWAELVALLLPLLLRWRHQERANHRIPRARRRSARSGTSC